MRCPSSAARTAVAAAIDVLPTPPLPVYTMMRIPSDTRANADWIEVHLPSGLLGMVYSATRCTPCLRSVKEPDLLWLLDYLLSGVNLGLGVFLVWRRPQDGVARLLGLAMVGTAAAFNLQAHTAFATVDTVAPELHAIVPIHWVLHAVSGAAYLHALLVFPNGILPAGSVSEEPERRRG